MVLRLSLNILMRSTDMLLSVERFCAPCDGDEGRGHLVCVCFVVAREAALLLGWTQLPRDSLRSRRDNRGDNLCGCLRENFADARGAASVFCRDFPWTSQAGLGYGSEALVEYLDALDRHVVVCRAFLCALRWR